MLLDDRALSAQGAERALGREWRVACPGSESFLERCFCGRTEQMSNAESIADGSPA